MLLWLDSSREIYNLADAINDLNRNPPALCNRISETDCAFEVINGREVILPVLPVKAAVENEVHSSHYEPHPDLWLWEESR